MRTCAREKLSSMEAVRAILREEVHRYNNRQPKTCQLFPELGHGFLSVEIISQTIVDSDHQTGFGWATDFYPWKHQAVRCFSRTS